MQLNLGVPPAGPKLTVYRYPVTSSNLVACVLWRWRRHQPFLHQALPQTAGKPHTPKPDTGPRGNAVQSQGANMLSIHTLGLTLGVTHHQGRGSPHVEGGKRGGEGCLAPLHPCHSCTPCIPGFTVSGVIPNVALRQRLRKDFRKSFYSSLWVYSTLDLGAQSMCHISTIFLLQ